MIGNDKVKPASHKEAATHRFPTSVLWGDGYFGDGMRYVVAGSVQVIVEYAAPFGIGPENVQVRDTDGNWRFARELQS